MRAVLVGATMTAMAAFGTGAAGASDADSISCHITGSVCIYTNDIYNQEVEVVEGQDYTFARATEVVSINNDTTLTYCAKTGGHSLSSVTVPPGQIVEGPFTVSSVTVLVGSGTCPV
ncbi:hypothetical protein GTY65_27085 [Streptomyces sp. SID8379]|uniref:hypothetical protein n=1 Tax=unclassified Streptomyces TaxID=2593676 RepID=UPI00037995A1|nr:MULTISPECIES: hypothetical protein [unclassified Streptomyces]MYW67709.1 hypothetical protein [Streptomyces sp. SID8379]